MGYVSEKWLYIINWERKGKREASNSKTSLANEKESFVLHSLFVSGLSNWSQNLASW